MQRGLVCIFFYSECRISCLEKTALAEPHFFQDPAHSGVEIDTLDCRDRPQKLEAAGELNESRRRDVYDGFRSFLSAGLIQKGNGKQQGGRRETSAIASV
jgi:hypothetical protein